MFLSFMCGPKSEIYATDLVELFTTPVFDARKGTRTCVEIFRNLTLVSTKDLKIFQTFVESTHYICQIGLWAPFGGIQNRG